MAEMEESGGQAEKGEVAKREASQLDSITDVVQEKELNQAKVDQAMKDIAEMEGAAEEAPSSSPSGARSASIAGSEGSAFKSPMKTCATPRPLAASSLIAKTDRSRALSDRLRWTL